METCTYTIRQISEKYQLPASTLRYYEEIGLLPEVKKNASNQRVYTEQHICRLDGIVCFKRTGMPITQIKKFYQYEQNLRTQIDDIISLVDSHEQYIQDKIKELSTDLIHIQKKVRYYHAIKESYENGAPFPDYDTI